MSGSSSYATRLLSKIWCNNISFKLPPTPRFVDSLAELGAAFNEPQVMGLAKSVGFFPETKSHLFSGDRVPVSLFLVRVGDFGRTTYNNDEPEGWESFGTSNHLKARVRRTSFIVALLILE